MPGAATPLVTFLKSKHTDRVASPLRCQHRRLTDRHFSVLSGRARQRAGMSKRGVTDIVRRHSFVIFVTHSRVDFKNGRKVLLRPIKGNAVGAMDLNTKKIVTHCFYVR